MFQFSVPLVVFSFIDLLRFALLPGHAGANLTPVIASNRYGREKDMIFYGLSFIADQVMTAIINNQSLICVMAYYTRKHIWSQRYFPVLVFRLPHNNWKPPCFPLANRFVSLCCMFV
jgi:hypothetical protein